ncbi:hypothetical protein AX774_g4065 [Zancudomyces culisetae]|uniref:Protein PET100, mitochondrial n=1 Tax=Zancudomyces culisetae TaxID=1213189 RepID=A0A1R1PNB5_ZANCU|nr:hypothetical protein AX774_g7974 [Zancudomyces culisetae]OMH82450.1 hypothetical protein AX774_g4065 [Zancudomyces culisetae]|eukprot:OMH78642.1 hypothetical protein AX774_g7974 [Zancudomyces culisetae]
MLGGSGKVEIIKFAVYVFLPVGTMTFFGAPYFYDRYVERDYFDFHPIPKNRPAQNVEGIQAQLQTFREQRMMRKEKIEREREMEKGEQD